MEEPSLLDYLKARLMPWRSSLPQAEHILADVELTVEPNATISPSAEQITAGSSIEQVRIEPKIKADARVLPWLSLLSMGLALLAHVSLEPTDQRAWLPGVFLYLLAFAFLFVATWRDEWLPASLPEAEPREEPMTVRRYGLFAGIPLVLLAFVSMGGNKFTSLNVLLWILAVAAIVYALWLPGERGSSIFHKLRKLLTKREWRLTITRWTVLVLAVAAVAIFFRVYQLEQVPPEMVSDQAEKLLDVWDVVHGETRIFFPRNTGREALQMYLTAAIVQVLNTGYSFLSLKIGTILAGLLALPFMYSLGKELGSRRIGLFAVLLAGIAYWPNVISRVGLRFPLYTLFVAPTLYYLIRGIRTSNRNDFILSGLFLGIGLHGYTPIRILPVVVLVGVGLYLIHRQSLGLRKQTIWCLGVLALAALLVFLPLMRYALENPGMFSFRAFSRLGTTEQPLPGPAGTIFLENLWKALTMFAWDDGEIWVTSVTHRPALDVISAALFYLGCGLLLVRYLRKRNWLDLFLLLSVPMLLMPSILSLAFPGENPSLNRMAGAIVPVFLIAALCLDGLMSAAESRLSQPAGSYLAWGMAAILVILASVQNYRLVFNEYQRVYRQSSWNTSEMGKVIRQFTGSVGTPDTAWVVAFPHWVDTRLVGINAGYPLKDYAIWPDQLQETAADLRAKLFLVKPEDTQGLLALQSLYPQGVLQEYFSAVENHNFYMYFVPPQQ